jgi:hypothetical protein
VATLTLSFVFMAGAFIWLSTIVDQSLHDRSQATAVAFQAARSGAQAVDLSTVGTGPLLVDTDRAVAAIRITVARLLAANGDTGELVDVRIDGATVTVSVAITSSGRRAVGTGTATARAGFDDGDQ